MGSWCTQICPVLLQGREDWIHAPSKPLVGVCVGGAVGLHPFCFVIRLFDPPSPRIFSLILV